MIINDTKGGSAWKAFKHTDETKNNISRVHKGRVWSDSQRRNVSIAVAAKNKRRAEAMRVNRIKKHKRPTWHFGFDNSKSKIVLHIEYGIFVTQREAAKMMDVSEQWIGVILEQKRGIINKTNFVLV